MTTENEENEAKEMMEEDQLNNQQDVSPKEKNGDETGTDKKDQKCVFYPNCTKQDTCPYFHPTELCKAFPSCTYGKNCRYIHPEVPCKYGIRCQRMGCSYAHPKKIKILVQMDSLAPRKIHANFLILLKHVNLGHLAQELCVRSLTQNLVNLGQNVRSRDAPFRTY